MSESVTSPRRWGTSTSDALRVVPRRSYVSIVLAVLAVGISLALAFSLARNPNITWSVTADHLFDPQVLHGVLVTVQLSILAMFFGIVLGVAIGLARMSHNRILRSFAAGYTMFFRGVPVLVQLLIWGNIGLLFSDVTLAVPGTDLVAFSLPTNDLIGPFTAAVIGLALHEAAYVAEIVRAGVMGVPRGQVEAASAMGMRPGRITRRVVLPQAMRMIIPPTGNQFVTLIKGTSLVSVIAGGDLLTQTQNIAARTYQVIEMLAVATLWYMVLVGVASVGQLWLERRFSRGYQR